MRFGLPALAVLAVCSLVAATPSSHASRLEGGEFYRLRLAGVDGKRTKLLFESPMLPNGYSRWFFVDLAPDRTHALMTEILQTGPEEASNSLLLADTHGRPQRQVVPPTAHFNPWARWSPDGKRFVYETFNGGPCGNYTFWSAAADGSDVRPLGSGQLFAWGPGHDSFAIERGCSPGGALGPLVSTDPSGREHVVAEGWAAGIAISPRGDRIAYETYGPSSVTLHIARTDGSGEIGRIPAASSAVWSPNGRRLAFAYGRAIAVAGADGHAVRRIARGARLRAPAWSPDGRRIAYVRDDVALETVAADGKHRTRVARARVLIDFWWSPDSRRIYYDAVTAGSGRPPG